MKIICISGHARSGKDTSAKILRQIFWGYGKRVLITHYADLLKFICEKFLGSDGAKDENGRHLLQYVGTDVVRKQEPDFWVNFIIEVLKFFPDQWDYVLIPDCRFANEIEKLREAGFDTVHIRIERDSFDNGLSEEQKNHISETSLDNEDADYIIHNTGTVADLYKELYSIVSRWEKRDYIW